ncbi:expressed unknown protein [Seminavis robusta]|uniref:Uncharacterized protein n=1 Tax=Seminavis robusta TaxID=568900 RepID=A0A9N8E790_9STRA|nr:expressed unknown protein [Seminavis robusta]|eukprot:Sro740_g195660.1 n/a (173) ;mRNA; f:48293-48989
MSNATPDGGPHVAGAAMGAAADTALSIGGTAWLGAVVNKVKQMQIVKEIVAIEATKMATSSVSVGATTMAATAAPVAMTASVKIAIIAAGVVEVGSDVTAGETAADSVYFCLELRVLEQRTKYAAGRSHGSTIWESLYQKEYRYQGSFSHRTSSNTQNGPSVCSAKRSKREV